MKEVITVQLGQCGNSLGSLFWEDVFYEHQVSETGKISQLKLENKPDVFLQEHDDDVYLPRAVLLDTDSALLERFETGPLSLLSKDYFVTSSNSNDMNYSNALNKSEFIAQSLEAIRKSAESCESLKNFQFFHSVAGGTGSGALKELFDNLQSTFPGKEIVTFTCMPSLKISELPLETINAVLGMQWLIESSAVSLILDNEKTYDLYSKHSEFSNFDNINSMMRKHVSDFTALLRFPDKHLSSYLKLRAHFVPFPRIHFLRASGSYELPKQVSEKELIMSTMQPEHLYYIDRLDDIKTFASVGISRGQLSQTYLKKHLHKFSRDSKFNDYFFMEPEHILHHHIEENFKECDKSFTFVHNSSNIVGVYDRINSNFSKILMKKVWTQTYLKNGMDEMEFTEAESNLNDLMSEYITWGCGCCCEDEDEDLDEESQGYNRRYSREENSIASVESVRSEEPE